MKKLHLFILTAAMLLTSLNATAGNDGKRLTALFSYSTFFQSGTGSYLETYISFDAWNLNFQKNADKYQATVEVVITVSKNDTIEVVKKYEVNSPKIASPDKDRFNFLDMQRFVVENGIHTLRVSLRDKYSSDEPTVIEEQIALYYNRRRTALSSVQMMSNVTPTVTPNILSRSGYDMEPYINDFLPEQVTAINYYCELYNIHRETHDPFVYLFSFIEVQETGKMIEQTQSAKPLERDSIIPIFGTIDIADLPSGNYNLVVEIRNEDNEKMLYKRVPFFRSNPGGKALDASSPVSLTFASQINDETLMNDYIEALAPIALEQERRQIFDLIHQPGLEQKQVFLYNFWIRREPLNAEGAWREYRQRIDYVNANFAWIDTKGSQTDRGRVYLKYGPPDYVRDEKNFVSTKYMGGGVTIIRSQDPSQRAVGLDDHQVNKQGQIFYLPYQLWRYNTIPGDDANRCFIFWDEFRTGLYKLLHSNAKGEVRDLGWERRLSQSQLREDMVGEVGEQFERGH